MNLSPELKKRVGTGLLGAAALLCLIIYGKWFGVFLITAVISVGMVYEFAGITFSMQDKVEKRYLLLTLCWLIFVLNAFLPQLEFALLVVSFLVLFTYFLFSAKRHADDQLKPHFREFALSVLGAIYLIFVPLYFLKIYDLGGSSWIVLFLLVVWSGDTGAYFAGKSFGKKKLYPEISPKKTIEGALGGLMAGLVVTVGFKLLFLPSLSGWAAFFIPVIVGTVAQIGDLCESFLKRAFVVKDSGSLLPGHGGFLDRFDGVVFSLPVMYGCMRVFA